ncbi:MAG: hypothetical protein IJ106_06860 [Parasporobacterium sp.]|nr:hypothetical protein [Parasporobacterium sp.]
MKKRLQKLYLTGILVTILMAAGAIFMTSMMKIEDTRKNMQSILQAAIQWTRDSNTSLQELADDIAAVSPPVRVVFLMDSGLALADSMEDADMTENHYTDPEVQAALENEIGRSLRISNSNGTLMMYLAQRVSPQLIIRISYPVLELARILLIYGALLLVVFLVLYYLQRRTITKLAKDQTRQFEDIQKLLDGQISQMQAVFPEFQPSLDAISYKVKRLQEDSREIMKTMNLRSEFVANASHELRSPLTSVKGFAEMLESGMAENDEERQLCIRMISSECDRMLEVIEDILHLSKAENAKERATKELAVSPVAREVCQALRPQAEQKGITLSVDGECLVLILEKDLWEVLYNLADNAVRYGREGGSVEILLEERTIMVRDDGVGMEPQHLGHIFEQFYRIDDTRESAPGGTGLGLSIVKTIVERSGGTITVTSTPGEGTCFLIQFA